MDARVSKTIDDFYNYKKQTEVDAWVEVERRYPLLLKEVLPMCSYDTDMGRLEIMTYIDDVHGNTTMSLSLARMETYAANFAAALEYYLGHREDIPRVLAEGYKSFPSKGLARLVPNWERALIGALTRLLAGEPISRNPHS